MSAQLVRPVVLLLLLSLTSPAAADDQAVLVKLYEVTNGAGWSGNSNSGWLGSEPPCSGSTANWAGLVTCTSSGCISGCSSDGRVVGL